MRDINLIVIHTSATPQDRDIGVEEIRAIHLARGFDDVGYHYVIRRNGAVEKGRNEERIGAHAKGHNLFSLGLCLIGGTDADDKLKAEFNYTRQQMAALEALLAALISRFPGARVLGHRDLPDVKKECPCFDVRAWWNTKELVA